MKPGGTGFLLGDGRLTYGPEYITESYYTLHFWRGIYPSVGLQHINNPGYNRAAARCWCRRFASTWSFRIKGTATSRVKVLRAGIDAVGVL